MELEITGEKQRSSRSDETRGERLVEKFAHVVAHALALDVEFSGDRVDDLAYRLFFVELLPDKTRDGVEPKVAVALQI